MVFPIWDPLFLPIPAPIEAGFAERMQTAVAVAAGCASFADVVADALCAVVFAVPFWAY